MYRRTFLQIAATAPIIAAAGIRTPVVVKPIITVVDGKRTEAWSALPHPEGRSWTADEIRLNKLKVIWK